MGLYKVSGFGGCWLTWKWGGLRRGWVGRGWCGCEVGSVCCWVILRWCFVFVRSLFCECYTCRSVVLPHRLFVDCSRLIAQCLSQELRLTLLDFSRFANFLRVQQALCNLQTWGAQRKCLITIHGCGVLTGRDFGVCDFLLFSLFFGANDYLELRVGFSFALM